MRRADKEPNGGSDSLPNLTARQHQLLCDLRNVSLSDEPVVLPPRVGSRINPLIEEGLVEKAKIQRDTAHSHVTLSPAGTQLLEQAAAAGVSDEIPQGPGDKSFQVKDTAEVINGFYERYKGRVIEVRADGEVVTLCIMVNRVPTPIDLLNWMLQKIDPIPTLPKCC